MVRCLPLVLALIQALSVCAQDQPYEPVVVAASDEGERAVARIQVPDGFRVELFAAEPLLANPVAFAIDERGRFFVAESFRVNDGVTDNRDHMSWLDDDLAARTVADRVELYRRHLGKAFDSYAVHHERVRMVEDRDGDGKADHATVFADGFNDPADGIGAGLLARRGSVWYACIPHLWLLGDKADAGRATEKRSLHYGYGVHVAFFGHDLHGLQMGPDGKLYFSIGDRGLHVETPSGTVSNPDSGAVLRCNFDGSDLELFATGLRNPQELAFDEFGNLFTGDNNSDSGDKARWVYVVDGGDSGWRIGYQYIEGEASRGPWNTERLWHTAFGEQAAYIVPPIAHLADGPSGLAYYPGTGLPDRYRGHFFLADFRGTAFQSGIRSLAVKPKGAGFELVDVQRFIWSVLATDVDFGPDGSIYVSDWVDGWTKTGKGRIYRVTPPGHGESARQQEVKQLLAGGFDSRSVSDLARLLHHPDMRVRQESQFALVARGDEGLKELLEVAYNSGSLLARLHAIWGLGQLARRDPARDELRDSARDELRERLTKLLGDDASEVRAQAARVLGDARVAQAAGPLSRLLTDPEIRVRFFAAQAIGKIGPAGAAGPVLEMIRDNADRDPFLRHAGVMALAGIADLASLEQAAKDPSAAVRRAAAVAYRRLENPRVAELLEDVDRSVALEAARAIYDLPIPSALDRLAEQADKVDPTDPLLFRALAANHRLGTVEHAARVARVAGRQDVPAAMRVEAIEELADWTAPSGRDRVLGLWRPVRERAADVGSSVAARVLPELVGDADESIARSAVAAAGKLRLGNTSAQLLTIVRDGSRSGSLRTDALKALETIEASELEPATRFAVSDKDSSVRSEGRRLLARFDPEQAIRLLDEAVEKGEFAERQAALASLGSMRSPGADRALAAWLDRLVAGQVPAEIQLDLLEAAGSRDSADLRARLAGFERGRDPADPLGAYRETLVGGDALRGRRIFFERSEVACLRCHRVQGLGGEVGPDLSEIGKQQKREYLLEALVDPNRQIAKGFESVVLGLSSGQVVTGVLREETDEVIRLVTAEGNPVVVNKRDVEERNRGPSAMPNDVVKHLKKTDIRDLVEFLVQQRGLR